MGSVVNWGICLASSELHFVGRSLNAHCFFSQLGGNPTRFQEGCSDFFAYYSLVASSGVSSFGNLVSSQGSNIFPAYFKDGVVQWNKVFEGNQTIHVQYGRPSYMVGVGREGGDFMIGCASYHHKGNLTF